jgi:hypothetical protein
MSDVDAISAVTQKLRAVIAEAGLPSAPTPVSTDPLDKLDPAHAQSLLNLYLYQILPNAAWRNADIPWKVKTGETAHPPLALDLRYLLTALADNQIDAHRHLGIAMQRLHDNPVLDPGGGAVAPFERARVTLHPLSLDDIEKVWNGIATPHRLSVAYEVSIILIESSLPISAPLPVLSRGPGVPDSASVVIGSSPFPMIDGIEIGSTEFDMWLAGRSIVGRSSAQLGDDLFLSGEGLGAATKAIITSLMHPNPQVELHGGFDTTQRGLRVPLPLQDDRSRAGICSIKLEVPWGQSTLVTNSVSFCLAPTIKKLDPTTFTAAADLTVDVDPKILANQRASLVVGDLEVAPKSSGRTTNSMVFTLPKELAGEHYVRLRVDGVDSIVVDLMTPPSGMARPAFSDSFKIVVR